MHIAPETPNPALRFLSSVVFKTKNNKRRTIEKGKIQIWHTEVRAPWISDFLFAPCAFDVSFARLPDGLNLCKQSFSQAVLLLHLKRTTYILIYSIESPKAMRCSNWPAIGNGFLIHGFKLKATGRR